MSFAQDVSNLNRQFLFRKKHVGQPKSVVARESALRICPDARIVAHHGNVKDAQFGPEFLRQFSVVLNALDNLDARRHMNRVCLAAGVPLIESGSAGYLGQVQVIFGGKSEVFRVSAQGGAHSISVLHHSRHTQQGHSQCHLGKRISFSHSVRRCS